MVWCGVAWPRAVRAVGTFRETITSRMSNASKRVRVLFDEAAIAKRNDELADEIVAAKPENLLVVAVLKGSFMFAADLLRSLHRAGLSPQVEFVHLSSYRNSTVSSGQVEILRDVQSEVRGRDVLLVDDILESGRTVVFAKDLLMARGAEARADCGALGEAGQARRDDRRGFRRFHLPGRVRRRLRHGRRPRLPPAPFVGLVDYDSSDADLFGGT